MRTMMPFLALLAAAPAMAQETWQATYIVQRDGREVGRERVVLRGGPAGERSRLEIESRYAGAPETARAVLSRDEGAMFESLQLELRRTDGTETIRVTNQGGRIFITSQAGGTRGGRELPGGPGVVMLDDRLLSLLVAVPDLVEAGKSRTLVAMSPRTGKRTSFTARRVEGGVELTGDVAGRISLDRNDRVETITLGNGFTLSRLPT